MGVLTKVRNGVVGGVEKAAGKAADGVTALSQLSPSQVRAIDDNRQKYLSEMPTMDSEAVEELTHRNLGAINIEVFNSYLPQISSLYLPIEEAENFDGNSRIAYFDITKWAKDPDEDNIQKLMSVYQVLSAEECNIALIYHRTQKECTISIAVVNNGKESDSNEVDTYKKRLIGALKGNFPGTEILTEKKKVKGYGVNAPEYLRRDNKKEITPSVAIVSNLATEKSEKFSLQTMEKVIDGIVPQSEKDEYTIILLATPVREQVERKNRMYELYSAIAPYANWQTNYTYSETQGQSSSATVNVNVGIGVGKQSGVSNSTGESSSTTHSSGGSESTTNQIGGSYSSTTNVAAKAGPVSVSKSGTLSVNASHAKTKSKNWGIAKTVAKVATDTISSGTNFGVNAGIGFARSSNVSATIGKNEGITQSFTNYGVKHMLDVLEMQLQRLEESTALGLWDFAAYVISDDSVTANNVAHTYLALTQGEESYLAEAAVNLWRADLPEGRDHKNEKGQARMIWKALSRLQHPEFCLKSGIPEEYLMYPTSVSATTSLSGKELARALNFPSKSLAGLPILEAASFGRETQKFSITSVEGNSANDDETASNKTLDIGNVVHMYRAEKQSVLLDINSLTSHVFVTGSTGSGKSNAVYQIVDGLLKQDKKVMVIEPAKGEYRCALGNKCQTYGTNPKLTKLLRINPFAFPTGNGIEKPIHVLEHIDRLIEILNACWPMYAAMPAVLKDAIEKAYINMGWDLYTSECYPIKFPTFVDLLTTLPEVMNNSLYSKDTQSDYAGALVTRVKSLTNGINGLILCASESEELSNFDLFEQNVIVDISRVGSMETKALLMGMLIMKLQEYHMSSSGVNEELQHVTIIEEAHNLLRKTSFGQGQESANLQGKSVEMLTNSIAEMRTYGEGFIIADQAPGLLDEAVIRNTNTKIILRLPNADDRLLVGKAAALSDKQIEELAKLPRGVAAVYQNDWVEAVLCQFRKYVTTESTNKKFIEELSNVNRPTDAYFELLFNVHDDLELKEEDIVAISGWIEKLVYPTSTKCNLRKVLIGEKLTEKEMKSVAYNLFSGKRLGIYLRDSIDLQKGIAEVDKKIKSMYKIKNDELAITIRQLILQYIIEHTKTDTFEKRFIEYTGRRCL